MSPIGQKIGSYPVYIAPEQARGARAITAQTDVYSLGVVLFEMLAGRPPFMAEGTGELLGMHIFQEPPRLRELAPGLPDDLCALVHRLLEKDPERRPTTGEVIAALEALGAPRAGAAPSLPPLGDVTRGDRTGGEVSPYRSTLGAANGQTRAPTRSRTILVAGVAGLAGSVTLAVVLQRGLPTPRPAVPEQQLRPAVGAAPLPRAAPAAPQRVRFSLRSTPTGAQVVRRADGVALGTTPFDEERPRGEGKLGLVLRQKGFLDRELELDLSSDQTIQETLQAVAARPSTGRGGKKTTAAPAPAAPAPVVAPANTAASIPEPPAPRKPRGMEDFEKLGGT